MGILVVLMIILGGLTPAFGVIMFTVCGILGAKTGVFARASMPLFFALVVFFVILAWFFRRSPPLSRMS